MRPFKHVAATTNDEGAARYQNILGIDLGRFHAPWGEVPIVATTETDQITIYYWSDDKRHWESFSRLHDALTTSGNTVDAPPTWNWSDRVAIVCASTTVYVIYKRANFPNVAALTIDRFVPDGEELRPRGSSTVPLAVGTEIGRSLWAGYDDKNDQLLVLAQLKFHPSGGIGPPHSFPFPAGPAPSWELDLLKIQFDQNDNIKATSGKIGDGGYDLDARLDGDRLLAVYRKTAEALRIRIVDLFEQNQFTSGTDADHFYEQLQLATVDVATVQETTEAIPGGEHPQIQNVEPLLITMDRPTHVDLSAKVEVDASTFPPTVNVSQHVWNQGRMNKIAWLRDTQGTFRGTLLTSDDQAIPRSHSAIGSATHLFELRHGFLLHASPFPYFPVSLLAIDHQRKDLVLDLLHHRDFIGLFRTRLRATLGNGVLTVAGRSFEVWDIGHAQIKDPLSLTPAADGENDQFAPFDRVPVTTSTSVTTGPLCTDNTMGGHLVADLSMQPVGFFAYTDFGDGCLRVIFAMDMPAPRDPPPMQGEKTLRPEQVTGPHLPCEEWIELPAADLINSDLISYAVGLGLTDPDRSLASSFEVAVDTLLNGCAQVSNDAAACGGAAVVPLDGVTRDQLVDVDELLSKLVPTTIPVILSDGRTATVSLNVSYPMACGANGQNVPAGLFIADMPVSLELTIDADGSKPRVIWTITPLSNSLGVPLPPGPIVPGGPDSTFMLLQRIAVGNGATIATGISETQRLSVFVTDDVVHAHTPAAATNIDVQKSSYQMLTSLTDSLAEIEYIRVGALSLLGLQYEIDFSADDPTVVKIEIQPQRATQLRFRGNGFRQGLIESDLVLTFSSQDIKLRYGLDLDGFVKVDDFQLSLHYGRLFTPGMLMRDVRSRDVLQGTDLGTHAFDLVKRNNPRRHAAIAAKPFTSTNIPKHSSDIGISITPWGISIPALLAALAIIGAFGIAETIVALYGAFLAAVALGTAGIVIAVALSIALAIYIATSVPRSIEDFIARIVEEKFNDGTVIDTLNQPPTDALIRYSGEGAAEAIARKVLARCQSFNFNAPQPATANQEDVGLDRFRGQIFQMIFVAEGVCRVLVRFDDCLEARPPQPPSPPHGDDGGIGVITTPNP